MRRWLAAMMFVAIGAFPQAQVPTAAASQFFAFDYLDADLASAQVTRFEMQIDGGAWTSVGMPAQAAPAPNGKTYGVPIPALTIGSHAVVFRACSADVCSAPGAAFTFRFIVVPNAPGNIRILGG